MAAVSGATPSIVAAAEANSIVDVAIAKAREFNITVSVAVCDNLSHVVAQGVPAIRIRGGLPIVRNGQIEGACGVGGPSSHEQEEECARAGIASIQR